MHVIPPYPSAVFLFLGAERVRRFASKQEALNALSLDWIKYRVYAAPWRQDPFDGTRRYPQYQLRDEAGFALTAKDFTPLEVPRVRLHRIEGGTTGPVPHTGRGRRAQYYRRPVTRQAKRMAQDFAQYNEPPVRLKRVASQLPSSWDDLPRSSARDRSWKRNRKHQWRA